MDKNNDFGPVITAQHKAKVVGYINSAEEQGANIVVDGRDAAPVGYENGFYVGATLIDQVTADMTSYKKKFWTCITSDSCKYNARSYEPY